eukprot:4963771-Prorocentrum_lima.AAC.1
MDGTLVPNVEEARYLGCFLNDHSNPKKELRVRIAQCFATWKKLDTFWLHSDCSTHGHVSIEGTSKSIEDKDYICR